MMGMDRFNTGVYMTKMKIMWDDGKRGKIMFSKQDLEARKNLDKEFDEAKLAIQAAIGPDMLEGGEIEHKNMFIATKKMELVKSKSDAWFAEFNIKNVDKVFNWHGNYTCIEDGCVYEIKESEEELLK
jgi:hypothetical protein